MRCRAAAQASKASKTRSQVSEKLRGHIERSCTYGGSCLARTGGMTKRLLLLCCFATGCSMYWGGDDVKNDDCTDVGYGAAPASQYYRDPSTGTCIAEGGGYYCGCGQPCPDNAGAGVAYPDWGQCYTSCDNLDEADCITTSGCHAAYVETILGAPVSTHTFYGCWQTSPSGNTGGACSGLGERQLLDGRHRLSRSPAKLRALLRRDYEDDRSGPMHGNSAVRHGTTDVPGEHHARHRERLLDGLLHSERAMRRSGSGSVLRSGDVRHRAAELPGRYAAGHHQRLLQRLLHPDRELRAAELRRADHRSGVRGTWRLHAGLYRYELHLHRQRLHLRQRDVHELRVARRRPVTDLDVGSGRSPGRGAKLSPWL